MDEVTRKFTNQIIDEEQEANFNSVEEDEVVNITNWESLIRKMCNELLPMQALLVALNEIEFHLS